MGYALTGDQFRGALKKLGEIDRQLSQPEYPFDPERLLAALNAILEGRFEAVGGAFPCQIHAADLIPKGWTVAVIDGVVQDVEPTADLDVSKLKPVSFLLKGKTVVSGEDMRKRARELNGNWGLSDAPRFLADKGKRIRREFQGFYIPLPGTILRDPDGNLHIPYLYFDGKRWYLDFGWLGSGWNVDGRLACSE